MAGNIKGITIEFEGKTTELEQAIKKIKGSTKDLDSELKKVNNALKFNPTNVELWRQKQTILNKKVQETEKNLKQLQNAQEQLDAKEVDENSAEYRQLQREIIETESKLKTFKGQLKQVGNVKLRAVSEQFKEMGNKLTSAGEAMRGLSTAGAVVAGSLGALAVKSGDAADELSTLSSVTGISVQNLQKYRAGADLVDVSLETIAKSQQKIVKSMASASSGTGKQADAFKALGVSVTNADGSLRDSDEVWNETIQALSKVENETQRNAMAMDIMGKSAMELNPLIEDGGKSYEMLAQSMKENDLQFVDQETLDGANRFNDALDILKANGLATIQTIGMQLASYLAPAMEKIASALGKVMGWLSKLSPQTLTIIGIIAAVIAAVAPVLLLLGKIAFAISSITGLMSTLGISFTAIAGPIGIAIAAIAAAIAIGVLLYKNWDKIKAFAIKTWNAITTAVSTAVNNLKNKVSAVFNAIKTTVTNIWNGIKTTISNVWNNIKSKVSTTINGIKSTVTNVFNAIKSSVSNTWNKIKESITKPIEKAKEVVKSAIDKIKSIINGAKLSLPHFKLPHFKIDGGVLPWGIGGKGRKPSISVDWYAKGGIFDSASLIGVGEKGAEAVVPLDTLWKKMDKIAEGSGGMNIVINVQASPGMDTRALAEEVQRQLINTVNRRRLAWQ